MTKLNEVYISPADEFQLLGDMHSDIKFKILFNGKRYYVTAWSSNWKMYGYHFRAYRHDKYLRRALKKITININNAKRRKEEKK